MSVAVPPIPRPDEATRGPAARAPSTRAAIVGAGAVTPLGDSLAATWDAVLAGRFVTDHARAAGGWDDRTPRVVAMAREAAAAAVSEAGWERDLTDVALIVGTSKGSVEQWIAPAAGGPSPLFDPAGLGDVAADLGARYGLTGPRLTVSAACASGLVALARAAVLIESGHARRALVVAAEASLHPLFLGSFKRLGVLPPPGVGCRPFDESRAGFLMSEAAAAVCLEARETATARQGDDAEDAAPHRPRVIIDRYALGADASHLTGADPAGRVLRHLIDRVLDGQGADLVHAHGTGTAANDPVELAAIDAALAALPGPRAAVYSHKGALGHSLGAAGLLAVVLSRQAHVAGIIPGNVRTTAPLTAAHLTIHTTARPARVHRSIALAAGFGGASAVVGLSSV
ncbi:MAG TPA: beta-ketoacyl synthase N-terminal-like domain-containing protein [Tepidisphaeraceae bacterium]|nr:beta-ketoacyl synthase N-terminal-like domain-containing protein [Tepidisphaeraceae bacterium]